MSAGRFVAVFNHLKKYQNTMLFSKDVQKRRFNKIFWLYHISWWFFLICVDCLRHIDYIFTKTTVEIVLLYFSGSLVGMILHLFFRILNYRSLSLFGLIGIIICSSIVTSYFWNAIIILIDNILQLMTIDNLDLSGSLDVFKFSFFYSILLITYSGLYFILKIWIEWINQTIQTEKAKRLEQQSQLQMLRYQLNPHFIFNALSSLRALVGNERAELMITKLSEFLRYTLDEKRRNEVPLSDEIEVTKHYLDIEKIRFGRKLIVNYDIDDSSREYLVPSFLINPLIENAIKHGLNTGYLPLTIGIYTYFLENEALVIEVTNTGNLEDMSSDASNDSARMGLDNVKKRLSFLYPDAYRYELFESGNEVHSKITLFKKPSGENGKTL